MKNQIGSCNKVAYLQLVDGAIARVSCPDGGIGSCNSFAHFQSYTSKMYSVGRRPTSEHRVPMFKSLQLGIYQSFFQSSPGPPVGIWLNHPKGGSSTPYHTRPNLCLIQLKQLFQSDVPPDLRVVEDGSLCVSVQTDWHLRLHLSGRVGKKEKKKTFIGTVKTKRKA